MRTENSTAAINKKIFEVSDLKVHFTTSEGIVRAVDGISFYLNEQETLAIVGESGCGKSVTAQTIMGLIKSPPAKITGTIKFRGEDILESNLVREYRGKKITMVFQEPMASFDPLYTIGYQMTEVIQKHMKTTSSASKDLAMSMLKKVHIPDAERRFNEYPHQMSGGMLQRIMIAISLLTNPEILIADEPTTALDVTIQAQVLNLIAELKSEFRTSTIFITHDLGIVSEIADRVVVMYAGKIVEQGTVYGIFKSPLHPYTQGLLKSRIEGARSGEELPYIPGFVPTSYEIPSGCPFHPRCNYTMEICKSNVPKEILIEDRLVSCHLYSQDQ